MVSSNTWIELTTTDKILIVNAVIEMARKIKHRYESRMYRKLAKKIVYTEGLIGLDGQELAMMAYALDKEADCCSNEALARLYRLMAQHLVREKKKFHSEVFAQLSSRYLFPEK